MRILLCVSVHTTVGEGAGTVIVNAYIQTLCETSLTRMTVLTFCHDLQVGKGAVILWNKAEILQKETVARQL